jgi:hypothetical protein
LLEQTEPADASFWRSHLTQQVLLGHEAFVERMQTQVPAAQRADKAFPKRQRRSGKTWVQRLALCDGNRNQALWVAYREAGLTMTAWRVSRVYL